MVPLPAICTPLWSLLIVTLSLLVTGTLLVAGTLFADEGATPWSNHIRSIVVKAVPVIVESGEDWMAQKDYLSCHRVSFTVWSLNRAAENGVSIDFQNAAETSDWATDWKNIANPKNRQDAQREQTLSGESDTAAQLLIGRPRLSADKQAPEWIAIYEDSLISGQQADGSWNAAGQLPLRKRPVAETREVTTMWSLIALATTSKTNIVHKDYFAKASKSLDSGLQGQSTEWRATKLLLAKAIGDATAVRRWKAALLEVQMKRVVGVGWLRTTVMRWALASPCLPSVAWA